MKMLLALLGDEDPQVGAVGAWTLWAGWCCWGLKWWAVGDGCWCCSCNAVAHPPCLPRRCDACPC